MLIYDDFNGIRVKYRSLKKTRKHETRLIAKYYKK